MKRRKIIKISLWVLLVVGLALGVRYAWYSFPIISGFDAKVACSCRFVSGQSETVARKDLSSLPLSLGSLDFNEKDSSVTVTVFGMAKRKAIFRSGLGCTLVNGMTEAALRQQNLQSGFSKASFTQDWPSGDILSSSISQGIDTVQLNRAFSTQFSSDTSGTNAMLVVYKGQLIKEAYAPGYNQQSMLLGWSMAKSVTSALIGVLVQSQGLDILQPAPVAAWRKPGDPRSAITIENLLQQSSGLDFIENYSSYSNVTNMLFNEPDMGGYTASRPLKHTPGTLFYYSSGNSNVLSLIIRNKIGERQYHRFPYDSFFHRIGMYHTLLEPDASGTFVGSSYVYASARDYARFGLLYLNDGVWNGHRILPEGWVRKTITPASTTKNYGYQWWLNAGNKFPGLPQDLFYADGFNGQGIYVVPSLQLVLVRLGSKATNEYALLKSVFDAVK